MKFRRKLTLLIMQCIVESGLILYIEITINQNDKCPQTTPILNMTRDTIERLFNSFDTLYNLKTEIYTIYFHQKYLNN